MKNAMLSVRVPAEHKERLIAAGLQAGKQCSDLLKEIIEQFLESGATVEASVKETTFVASGGQGGSEENLKKLTALIDEAIRLEDRREKLKLLVEENGGEPGWLNAGAPEHLRQAVKLCDLRRTQINEDMKALEGALESAPEFDDFQQCLSCRRLVVAGNYCTADDGDGNYVGCGATLPRTNRIWRRLNGWEDDFKPSDFAAEIQPNEKQTVIS